MLSIMSSHNSDAAVSSNSTATCTNQQIESHKRKSAPLTTSTSTKRRRTEEPPAALTSRRKLAVPHANNRQEPQPPSYIEHEITEDDVQALLEFVQAGGFDDNGEDEQSEGDEEEQHEDEDEAHKKNSLALLIGEDLLYDSEVGDALLSVNSRMVRSNFAFWTL